MYILTASAKQTKLDMHCYLDIAYSISMLEVYVILRLHHSLITMAVLMVLTRLGELRWDDGGQLEEKNDPSSVRPSLQNSPETWGDIAQC